jgi:hypothetical protein
VTEVTFTRTRQAYGSQIREALDQLVARGVIIGWKIETSDRDGLRYVLEDERMFAFYKPGKCAAMLNEIGFDIRFGKA